MPPVDPQLAALIRQMAAKVQALEANQQNIADAIQKAGEEPQSITAEIDKIKGRRIWYTLNDRLAFTSAQAGLRGTPLTFLISQDGPFICTHYPCVLWKPDAPSTATNLGMWSPVTSFPVPVQQFVTDGIDLSYEVVDSGSQRNFQNEAVGPIFSRPDNLVPLPVPTLFSPNTVIQFYPTFERIFFSSSPAVPTTGGELWVGFPGYRVVNM